MPASLRDRVGRFFRRLRRRAAGRTAAITNSCARGTSRAVGAISTAFQGFLSFAADFVRSIYDWLTAAALSVRRFVMKLFRYAFAGLFRYWPGIIGILFAAGFSYFSWLYWPAAHKPHHHHVLFRPVSPDVVHRVFPRDATKDTRNGDYYYLVNMLFIPLQTGLLLLAGFAGFRTLRQGHHFKQYDVEAACIRDYLEIERQISQAGTEQDFTSAVRSYWVLMLYEYYWWRKDLLSRELFANWCQFRVQRFRTNANYALPGTGTPSFRTYRQGYEHFRTQKVFPSPSRFDDLMTALMDRATTGAGDLNWKDIERFRHGFGKVI